MKEGQWLLSFNWDNATRKDIKLKEMIGSSAIQAQKRTTENLKCTYLGNSFGGVTKWAQNYINNISVTADGKVFTNSGWDEGYREYGVYTKCDVTDNKDIKPNSLKATDCKCNIYTVENKYLRFTDGNVEPVLIGSKAPYIKCSDGDVILKVNE